MLIYRTINDVKFAINPEKPAGLLCSPEIADQIQGSIFEFVEYIFERKKEYVPILATWEITNTCNFRCPFCYINTSDSIKVTQSLQSLKDKIDDLVESGLLLVYLTGGEVLSVPDFEEIYSYLKMKGVFVVILSNLSLLNARHIELFKKYPPLRITASVYGVNAGQFSAVTGQPAEVMEKVKRNILLLKKMGINVTCQLPVNKYTEKDYPNIAEWCRYNKIILKVNNELTDSYYGDNYQTAHIDDEEFSVLKKAVMKEPESTAVSSVSTEDLEFGYRYYFNCVSGKHTFAVSYNNHLRPCFNIWESDCKWFDGNLSMKKAMQSMKEYIKSMQTVKVEGCKGCFAHAFCGECDYTKIKYNDKKYNGMRQRCVENNKKIIENWKGGNEHEQ